VIALTRAILERIRDGYDSALYKLTYTSFLFYSTFWVGSVA